MPTLLHATLAFVLQSSSPDPIEIVKPIELPAGMIATGVTVELGDEPALTSVPLRAATARAGYEGVRRRRVDPALLEVGEHGIELRVYPVQRGKAAKVTIALAATSLVAAQRLVHLDEHVSLLAAPPWNAADAGVWGDGGPYTGYWPVTP